MGLRAVSLCVGLLITAGLALPQPTSGVRVVIPNCCSTEGKISVINALTGAIEGSVGTGAISTGTVTFGLSFALLKGGRSAAVASQTYNGYPAGTSAWVLTLVNFTSGKASGPLTLPQPSYCCPGYTVAVNPQSGVIYAAYGDYSAGLLHIVEINPTSLTIIRNVAVGPFTTWYLIVSPDGQRVYAPVTGGIMALDASKLQPVGTIPVPSSANSLAVSPDSSTLYVATSVGAGDQIDFVDTVSLQVTQTVPLPAVAGLGISPDGTQLYIAAGNTIETLDVNTLALSSVPDSAGASQIVVSPNGTVYAVSAAIYSKAGEVAIFDPVSQAITATFAIPAAGFIEVAPDAKRLYLLSLQVSSVAVTRAAPSSTILHNAVTGWGLGGGAVDMANHLVMLPDYYRNVELLDASTLQPKGFIQIPTLDGWVAAAGGSGYALVNGGGMLPGVVQFNPSTQAVGPTIQIPCLAHSFGVIYNQPAVRGDTLYIPFKGEDGICKGIAVINAKRATLVATWTYPEAPSFAVAPGSTVGYAAFYPSTIAAIDLHTGKVTQQLQLPLSGGVSIGLSPDGSTIYAFQTTASYIINAQSLTITSTLPGSGLSNPAVTPDGQYIYGSIVGAVEILSTSSLAVVGTIPVISGTEFVPVLFVGI